MNDVEKVQNRDFRNALKALKLGYRYSDDHSAYICIRDYKNDGISITICPTEYSIPDKITDEGDYYAWWDDKSILYSSKVLRGWIGYVEHMDDKSAVRCIENKDGRSISEERVRTSRVYV